MLDASVLAGVLPTVISAAGLLAMGFYPGLSPGPARTVRSHLVEQARGRQAPVESLVKKLAA